MRSILYIGSEALPFAATGGLGDVMGALPKAVKAQNPNIDVRAVMPLYSQIKPQWREKMKFEKSINVKLSWRNQYCGIFSLEHDGVKWYFIDNEYYFKRQRLYGEYDDAERFAFFSMASLELMRAVGFYPEIIHCNDWQSALAVIQLKRSYESIEEYAKIRAVYTIHNIDYQGEYGMEILGDIFSLSASDMSIVEYHGNINLTKGAIVCADYVTTVSPRYAQEIQSDSFAKGLATITNMFDFKIGGVINGIDTEIYDPEHDVELVKNYSSGDICGKAVCKAELQKELGLKASPDTPIIAMISRLAEHKGFSLVKEIADMLVGEDDAQVVILGTGEQELENFFREFAQRHPGKVSATIAFDKALSKRIYAGADIFLMPSKSEPCGLSQMIASRYGTVPVIHEVGGLYDTIKPYAAGGNGFTFTAFNSEDMLNTVRHAESLYHDKEKWAELVEKVMNIDFSWDVSAKTYVSLYDRVSKF
ncbi:MAG: glycogen synthase GlgA [Clostridia bacterium]|nr:glycogen synthase GlgA [Clostridia bacterium]